jgi:hypothetical protein
VGPFEIIVGLAALSAAAFQIWLTVRVFRSRLYERRQKVLQVELIWLLPIVGAALVFSVLREDDTQRRTDSHLTR